MDRVDGMIVALLREDARRSYMDIGHHVHLSAPAVKRRVDRLERDRVILGYTAIVDPTAFGWNAEAFVDLYCDGDVSGEAIKRAVEPEPRAGARTDPRSQGGQPDSHPGGAVDAVQPLVSESEIRCHREWPLVGDAKGRRSRGFARRRGRRAIRPGDARMASNL